MSEPRTAVVVIHGIGEQRPMSTIRGFVRCLCGRDFRSKPDRASESFELRRLAAFVSRDDAGKEPPFPRYPYRADFYEYYWAPAFRDTRWGHLFPFVWRVLRTSRDELAPCRRYLWWVTLLACLMILALVGVPLGLYLGHVVSALRSGSTVPAPSLPSWLSVAGGVIATLAAPFAMGYIGDAARYLHAAPANIADRQKIRAEGVRLLEKLHEPAGGGRPAYDRVVVVGHSLGSVIAYDVLTHYWARVNQSVQIEEGSVTLATAHRAGNAAQAGMVRGSEGGRPVRWEDPEPAGAEEFRSAQPAIAKEAPSAKWRITDLITLGSPLTHGAFLLAADAKELRERQQQRELPTCPPWPDTGKFKDKYAFSFLGVSEAGKVVPHHAAMFLVTRWTNCYFISDPVGGPVAPVFGPGVRDERVGFGDRPRTGAWATAKEFLTNPVILSHVRYWETDPGQGPDERIVRASPRVGEILLDAIVGRQAGA